MKRTLVFLLLGPASAIIAWLIYFVETGGDSVNLAVTFSLMLLCFTSFFAIIAWFIDGALARFLPLLLRVPLIAVVGASGGLFLGALEWMFLTSINPLVPETARWELLVRLSMPFVIAGALCMGMCSLLSHDYGFWHRRAAPEGGPPSSSA